MGLKNKLYNFPNNSQKGPGGPSKSIGFDWANNTPPLVKRVSWDTSNEEANPTFEGVGGADHNPTFGVIDSFVRGGLQAAGSRRLIDAERIFKFYLSPNGIQFLAKEVILQALTPVKPKIYNLGVNTLASVAAAGVTNIKRGGLLPNLGGTLFKDKDTYLNQFEEGEETNTETGVTTGGKTRENRYGLGSFAETPSGFMDKVFGSNPFTKPGEEGYAVSLDNSITKIDKINLYDIIKMTDNSFPVDLKYGEIEDFVNFRFEVVDHSNPNSSQLIQFRAFIDSISDNYSATHNEYKYNGRAEKFYTYSEFDRKISISFKIAAQSRHEMVPLYKKLNFLVAQTAPGYTPTHRMTTPLHKLTVGDWFNRIPGIITSVNLTWAQDYVWEIKADKEKDKDMVVLPHALEVSVDFTPIHSFVPENVASAPFIGGISNILEKEDNTDTSSVSNENNEGGIVLNDQDSSFSDIFA